MEDCLNVVFEEIIIDEIFMSMEFLKEVDMKQLFSDVIVGDLVFINDVLL